MLFYAFMLTDIKMICILIIFIFCTTESAKIMLKSANKNIDDDIRKVVKFTCKRLQLIVSMTQAIVRLYF